MIHKLKFRPSNSFYNDYVSKKETAQNILGTFDKDSIRSLSNKLSAVTYPAEIRTELLQYNQDLKSEKAQKYKSALSNPNARFIVTGQQLGILGSPMYTFYKALTAVKLAEVLNLEQNEFFYIPLFWLESEDHDFQEVNHFRMWDRQFGVKKYTYTGEDKGRCSMRHYQFDSSIAELIKQVDSDLADTEFKPWVMDFLRENYQAGNNWIQAEREMLKLFFDQYGLLYFPPGEPGIKRSSSPLFEKVAHNAEANDEAFVTGSREMVRAGYDNQVSVIPGKAFLFFENDELQREHLLFGDHSFNLSESRRPLTKDNVLQFIRQKPHKVSTNVVSRTLLQSYLMPVSCYVAGPGEIAYWGQLGMVFKMMKLERPVVYPRISATLVEPKIQRYFKKLGLEYSEVGNDEKLFLENFAKNKNLEDLQLIESGREQINEVLVRLKQNMLKIDATLDSAWQKAHGRIQQQFDFIQQKTLNAIQQQNQVDQNRLRQIYAAFYPQNLPQERAVSILYFINKFGLDSLRSSLNELDALDIQHQVLQID